MSGFDPDLLAGVPASGAGTGPFGPGDVPDDELRALLAAARVAPSADNLQTWRFVTVRDPATRARLGEALGGPAGGAVAAAPVAVVACGVKALVKALRREQPFVLIDVPIAVAHLLLQARELGLRTAWTLLPDEPSVRACLGIPDDVRVIAVVAVGRA